MFSYLKTNVLYLLSTCDRLNLLSKRRRNQVKKYNYDLDEQLETPPALLIDWPTHLKKPIVGLVKENKDKYAYWPKFERFLNNNDFTTAMIDIHRSDFIEQLKGIELLIWRVPSNELRLNEGKKKIYFIENQLQIQCLPSVESLSFYEDKVYQSWLFKHHLIPTVETFASYDYQESLDYVKKQVYPRVFKWSTASASRHVYKIKSKRQATRLVHVHFNHGLTQPRSCHTPKNHVLFQAMMVNQGFDLRICIIGDYYLGYYRYPKKGDFRASGSGIWAMMALPEKALRMAQKIKQKLPKTDMLAIDFLVDKDDEYYVIETALFTRFETGTNCVVNGVSGRYHYDKNTDKFVFEAGVFWPQEMYLEVYFKAWIACQTIDKV